MKQIFVRALTGCFAAASIASSLASAETGSQIYKREHPKRWAAQNAYQQKLSGRVVSVTGKVLHRKSNWDCDDQGFSLKAFPCRARAVVGTELRSGDRLNTLEGSSAVIQFTDESKVTLRENSALACYGELPAKKPEQSTGEIHCEGDPGCKKLKGALGALSGRTSSKPFERTKLTETEAAEAQEALKKVDAQAKPKKKPKAKAKAKAKPKPKAKASQASE